MLNTSSSVSREKTGLSTVPADPLSLTGIPVEQVQRVGRVVVQAAAALALLTPPGGALRLEHDRPVRLGQQVADPADRPEVEQPLDLCERADVAVVVADLGDQAACSSASAVSSADSAGSRQSGFSQKTCSPRSRALRTIGACSCVGVAMTTASSSAVSSMTPKSE